MSTEFEWWICEATGEAKTLKVIAEYPGDIDQETLLKHLNEYAEEKEPKFQQPQRILVKNTLIMTKYFACAYVGLPWEDWFTSSAT